MIHIVFEEANKGALEKSFELDTTMAGEVVIIRDDYAVGPINNIYALEGIENRANWWKDVLTGGPFEHLVAGGFNHDHDACNAVLEKLRADEEEVLWIWAAQNKHDVSGYYWLVSQLKDFQGRIFILYLNNLPFINEKGNIFYPTSLFQIQPKEFVKAKKLARPITLSEFEIDPDEWQKLGIENKGVRLLEGGKKLAQKGDDYYDAELLNYIGHEWLKVQKVFNQFFSKAKETTGDAFLFGRVKELIRNGKIVSQGDVRNLREFELKLASEVEVPVEG
ncbi:DUF1835 domain-containing protein [Segetibacter sp. 3557_3]|uniref:DUF1835 domain-containing protein n=1 Tax=Segetibacter sp. 3557_3 TaxID=2547429 RepID=UPI001058CB37|nr:DUF1835 domain-containing protein [Segetibacter sp. 3557_3]TDH27412.1 DUF1835 domain-containing protein [Segetibacter sp. 3557_3]